MAAHKPAPTTPPSHRRQPGLPDLRALETFVAVCDASSMVLAAERLGLPYGLRLPGLSLPPDQGLPHQRRCLEALALC